MVPALASLQAMPRTVHIRSENADYQHLDTLRRNRQKRARSGEFLVEGVRSINAALQHGWEVRALVYAGDRSPSRWAQEVLASGRAGVHYLLPGPLMDGLSARHEGSELLAVLSIPPDDPARIPTPPDLRVVVFDRPASPGNLGSLIRSADALGAHGLIVLGHAADLYDPETVRAGTGSLFALPCLRLPGPRELESWLDSVRARHPALQVVGADERGSVVASKYDFSSPTVLLLGNETRGLSAALLDLCDATVRIPMTGSASSLNVAAAGTALLYELDRQRREPSAPPAHS